LRFAPESRAPKLLVAAQPTRGVYIAGTAFIHREILAYRKRGGAVLVISEELDELFQLSDRILAMCHVSRPVRRRASRAVLTWPANVGQGSMTSAITRLVALPCIDSSDIAEALRSELDIGRSAAAALGRSAVEASRNGYYTNADGEKVDLRSLVQNACAAKRSIAPDDQLPAPKLRPVSETRVQVANETTLQASRRLFKAGLQPLALNFANGIHPGGGFLNGARAQEEVLCRSSALYLTLVGDPMYECHAGRPQPDSTDWAIYSPDVPVFRTDDGTVVEQPWPLSFVTSAAPYAPAIGQPASGDLLQKRIVRVLGVAAAYGHRSLVLGAWGCGAFKNDPHRTAKDFRQALKDDFAGLFSRVVFAVTDWSPERRFLGPFRDTFA
jgi:uncharacterized protein (TIGR02452 family)